MSKKPKFTTRNGTVLVYTPNHPRKYSGGYFPEHRLVMETHLGRHLDPSEHIQHKNGNRSDNRIENLEIRKPAAVRKHQSGYIEVYAPEHSNTNCGYMMEHRLIVEKHLGRVLKDYEVVHHVNEDKTDNRIENLKVLNRSEHAKIHNPRRMCRICGQYVTANGLCQKHFKQERYRLKLDWTRCEDCNKPVPKRRLAKDGRSLCWNCRFAITFCSLCDQITHASGLCKRHYKQWRYCNSKGLTYQAFKGWLITRKRISDNTAHATPSLDY